MSLALYLEQHFVNKPAFAAMCGISAEALTELIDAGLVPRATYIVRGTTLVSAVFGAMAPVDAQEGEYFRPQCKRWVRIALGQEPDSQGVTPGEVLRRELCAEMPRLNPGFSAADVAERVEKYLPYFFDGMFGLCVSDPSNGAAIARKEILQERLVALTDNGANPSPDSISKADLLRLIDGYARSAMPFSPVEYARSSRKRLVDDLRSKLV